MREAEEMGMSGPTQAKEHREQNKSTRSMRAEGTTGESSRDRGNNSVHSALGLTTPELEKINLYHFRKGSCGLFCLF